jgi:hypothetical protein
MCWGMWDQGTELREKVEGEVGANSLKNGQRRGVHILAQRATIPRKGFYGLKAHICTLYIV